MSIYIVGSLAYDKIMNFPEKFSDHILPEKLHVLNVCFLIKDLIERRGGTAGNIAYTLALMKEKPYIISTAGKDFAQYKTFLLSLDLPLDGIQEVSDKLTAGAYITTDKNNNQITGFYPAAMNFPCKYNFPNANAYTDWGIIAPTNVEDMQTIPQIFKEKNINYIFDPGQQIPVLSSEDLIKAISGSALLVTNDYELSMVCKKTNKTRLELQELTGGIITTLGNNGCIIYSEKEEHLPIAIPQAVLDPTGAGDAFRGGLLKGLTHGLNLVTSSKIGTISASFCVEQFGTQEHTFTYTSFAERYEKTFNSPSPIHWEH